MNISSSPELYEANSEADSGKPRLIKVQEEGTSENESSPELPVIGTPMKNTQLETIAKSEDMDVSKNILNSLLPP